MALGDVDSVVDVTAIVGAGRVGKGPSSTIGGAVRIGAPGPPVAGSPHAVEHTIAAMAQHDRQRFIDRNAMGLDRRSTGFTQTNDVDWFPPAEGEQPPTLSAGLPA